MPKGKLYNGDFKKYFDSKHKRNFWVLGYFGGGSLNVIDSMTVAKDFAKATGLPLETVQIDEILSSRRFKGFKFLFSTVENQKQEKGVEASEDVYAWLRD